MNTRNIAMDTQPHQLQVGLQRGTKKRELFVVIPTGIEPRMQAHFLDLFNARLVEGVNLIDVADIQRSLITVNATNYTGIELPSYVIPELKTFIPEKKDYAPEFGISYKVLRFTPFLPQNLACTTAKCDCKECKFLYPCEMGHVPLGILEQVVMKRNTPAHRSGMSVSLYNVHIDCIPLYGPSNQDLQETDYRDLPLFGGTCLLYGYGELFSQYPEFKDCFQMYSPGRKKNDI